MKTIEWELEPLYSESYGVKGCFGEGEYTFSKDDLHMLEEDINHYLSSGMGYAAEQVEAILHGLQESEVVVFRTYWP